MEVPGYPNYGGGSYYPYYPSHGYHPAAYSPYNYAQYMNSAPAPSQQLEKMKVKPTPKFFRPWDCEKPRSQTMKPKPETRRSPATPRQVHPTPKQVHPTPRQMQPTPRQVHPTPRQEHPIPRQVHPTPRQVHPTPRQEHRLSPEDHSQNLKVLRRRLQVRGYLDSLAEQIDQVTHCETAPRTGKLSVRTGSPVSQSASHREPQKISTLRPLLPKGVQPITAPQTIIIAPLPGVATPTSLTYEPVVPEPCPVPHQQPEETEPTQVIVIQPIQEPIVSPKPTPVKRTKPASAAAPKAKRRKTPTVAPAPPISPLMAHPDELEYKFNCEKCERKFYTQIGLHKHIIMRHREMKGKVVDYPCQLCNKSYKSLRNLNQHLVKVHNEGDHPYKCNNCEAGFFKLPLLLMHMDRDHFPGTL